MKKTTSIALVGISGYAASYLSSLLDQGAERQIEIVGIVDPYPERCTRIEDVRRRNIPVYSTLKELYAPHQPELIVISTPIHLHCSQTCFALTHGSFVLCEKPLGAVIQEAEAMAEAERRSGKWVAIGYQWSFSRAIQTLKQDIQRGLFGRPRRMKSLVLWPRTDQYYARGWAGKIRDEKGAWILDSPVNNAAAHYLHNMFYLLGEKINTSGIPVEVTAELYRANPIENYDTAALRTRTENGVEILFFVSHAVNQNQGPIFLYEFDHAVVHYNAAEDEVTARFRDGRIKSYGSPNSNDLNKLWDSLAAIRTGESIACGVEAAKSQTLCHNGVQESMPEIGGFPENLIRTSQTAEGRQTWVQGLAETLFKCYDENVLPAEINIPWSKKGQTIPLKSYRRFPSFASI